MPNTGLVVLGRPPKGLQQEEGPRLRFVVGLSRKTVRRIEYQVGRQFRTKPDKPVLREFIEDLTLPLLEKHNPYLSRPATIQEVRQAVENRSIL